MGDEDMDEQTCWGTYELSLGELEALPTITEGQADDLKIESDTERVWLSRCTVGDGEPWDNKVTVERLVGGSWVEVEWWVAEPGDEDEDEDEDEVGFDAFTVNLEMGNAAMSTRAHIVAALRDVAQRMEDGAHEGRIRDENGNTVGSFELS